MDDILIMEEEMIAGGQVHPQAFLHSTPNLSSNHQSICVWRIWCTQENHIRQHQQQTALQELADHEAALQRSNGKPNRHPVFDTSATSKFHLAIAALLSPIYYVFPSASLLLLSVLLALKNDVPALASVLHWTIVFIPLYLIVAYVAIVGLLDLYTVFCAEFIHEFLEREFLLFRENFWRKANDYVCFFVASIFVVMLSGFLDREASERTDSRSLNLLFYLFIFLFLLSSLHDIAMLLVPGYFGAEPSSSASFRERGFSRPRTTLYIVLKLVFRIIASLGVICWWAHFDSKVSRSIHPKFTIEIVLSSLAFLSIFLIQPSMFVVRKLMISSRAQKLDQDYVIDALQVVTELLVFTLVTLVVSSILLSWNYFQNAELKLSTILFLPWLCGSILLIAGTSGSVNNFKQAATHFGGQPQLPWLNDNDLRVLMEMS